MGMCICNGRRWPETYRVMGLQGVEMVMLGYNTPYDHTSHADSDSLTQFHNHLSMQAGAYQNSTWVAGTAECGVVEGSNMVGQSVIVAPSGEIVAVAVSLQEEVSTARCDLDLGKRYRETISTSRATANPAPTNSSSNERGRRRRPKFDVQRFNASEVSGRAKGREHVDGHQGRRNRSGRQNL